MIARILRARFDPPDPVVLDAAVRILNRQGIVAFPTETFYGLAVDPSRAGALRELFLLKGRSAGHPVPVLLSGRKELSGLVREPLPDSLSPLVESFWPGPLTLVLTHAGGPAARAAVSDRGTIAVRVTSHPLARALIERFGGPLTGTSANRTGQPPMRNPEEVREVFGDGLDLVLDGGPSPGNVPSTLLDLTGDRPVILREGAISRAEIGRVLGETPG
ncbi:MAG: L-threonylcarbamoyladenylate synthase [Acidobacteria bacterium]|nr:L-threonylcarbamoyladenylate synthase [Acidobacteriota bacterium]